MKNSDTNPSTSEYYTNHLQADERQTKERPESGEPRKERIVIHERQAFLGNFLRCYTVSNLHPSSSADQS